MIYGLYWKTTGKRCNSNTTSLLFATKKGADSYIKNQKSHGLNKALFSKPFTGKTLYNLLNKHPGFVYPSTLEKDIAEETVMQSRNGVMGVASLKIKISRPKEIYAVVDKLYSRITYVFPDKESAAKYEYFLQTTGLEYKIAIDYKVIKIK